jgi:hypothetical protein
MVSVPQSATSFQAKPTRPEFVAIRMPEADVNSESKITSRRSAPQQRVSLNLVVVLTFGLLFLLVGGLLLNLIFQSAVADQVTTNGNYEAVRLNRKIDETMMFAKDVDNNLAGLINYTNEAVATGNSRIDETAKFVKGVDTNLAGVISFTNEAVATGNRKIDETMMFAKNVDSNLTGLVSFTYKAVATCNSNFDEMKNDIDSLRKEVEELKPRERLNITSQEFEILRRY